MLRKEDVIKMLTDWKESVGNNGISEIAEVVIDLAINKIQAMPEYEAQCVRQSWAGNMMHRFEKVE